ncbi:MAG: TldD/PmbA family protein [Candidatus Dormibacteria bacterium]
MTRDLMAMADAVLNRLPGSAGAEVSVHEDSLALTRFALNAIHQNVAETSLRMRLRLVSDGRVGVAELRSDAQDGAARLVDAAERARRLSPAGDVSPLPTPTCPGGEAQAAFSATTAAASPDLRAEGVGVIAAAAVGSGLEAFGAFSTACNRTVIVNTAGVRRHAQSTAADLVAVVRGADGAGYADRHSFDVAAIDCGGLAREVIDTCSRNQAAVTIEPGDYEVVLSPYAVADLVEHLSWVGFSALAHQEGRSFMRPGERLMSESITIDEDPSDPRREPFPFDSEGVCTRPVSLIDRGVCRNFVHDTATALREGGESTGHALPMPNTWGPVARHLAIAAGDRTVEDLIRATERGLYVNRLWYVRSVHPLRTIITGMTREGTFRIDGGRLGPPVKDLRFTQSIVDALGDVRGIGGERSLHRAETENTPLVPHLHLGSFSFTS